MNNYELRMKEAIKSAEAYLHSEDEEIETQIEKILAVKDENTLIDYIDGISVWQPIEYTFTPMQFLEAIGYPLDLDPESEVTGNRVELHTRYSIYRVSFNDREYEIYHNDENGIDNIAEVTGEPMTDQEINAVSKFFIENK